MKNFILIFLIVFFISYSVKAEEVCIPPEGGRCLTKEQFEIIKKAVEELHSIHTSKAIIEVRDKIIIVEDWQGRIYLNGGESIPINIKMKIGDSVDRDLVFNLPTQVYYREKPPDPMFRLRIRAQTGILFPQFTSTIFKKDPQIFWDVNLALDFFHIDIFNVAIHAGSSSFGGELGMDITKNFGVYVGPAINYSGFSMSVLSGVYFSFNLSNRSNRWISVNLLYQ